MAEIYPLKSITLGGNTMGPHLLITGGVHGDEFEPMIALRQLAGQLAGQAIRGRVTLVPVVNEPAFARGHRAAEDQLDLARTCPGRPDGSVTERIAHALSELIRSSDYYLDLHTGGTALAVWPMTGYVLHSDPAVLVQQRAMARAFNLPVIWGTDPTLPGRSLSVARDARVPAIYAEYFGSAQSSAAGVAAYVAGSLNVLRHLRLIEGPIPRRSDVELVVEDPRPSGGHMQRCYPSPLAGCFEAEVTLGQRVKAGDLLGTVVDPLGRERSEVRATETGLILTLRTFPSVQPGDSLAVIVDTGFAISENRRA